MKQRSSVHLLALAIAAHHVVFARTTQVIPRASIADTEIGWTRPHTVPAARKPLQVDDKLYSAAQLPMADASRRGCRRVTSRKAASARFGCSYPRS